MIEATFKFGCMQDPNMSAMRRYTSPNLKVVGSKFKDILEVPTTSLKMRKVVISLCNIIATRGARLSAAGIYRILKKIFSEWMESSLKELLGEEASESLEVIHSNDGSGVGAALLAPSVLGELCNATYYYYCS
uniref:Phosphotransferase n=1 Tax=Brassica campestris TaxID=3711 RepID=M4EQN2_BRACM